jgi:outer membrane protein assembly factor BamB
VEGKMNKRISRFTFLTISSISLSLFLLVYGCYRDSGGIAFSKGKTQYSSRMLAKEIFDNTGIEGGLIVHLGCKEGKLTSALYRNERYLVHALARSNEALKETREYIQEQGIYGKVSVKRWDHNYLPYTDNLVNLLVAEDPGGVSRNELMRVLAPFGVAYIKEDGKWIKTIKPWPTNIGEWSHWRCGADGNPVSKDEVVGPPSHLQWVESPRWMKHHNMLPSLSAMVSAGGRIFYIVNQEPAGILGMPGKWFLLARDAFNGIQLWKKPIKEWGWEQWSNNEMGRFNQPIHLKSRLVATKNRVYITLGFNAPVTALDAATGETVRVYSNTNFTSEIAYKDGILFLSVNKDSQGPGQAKENPPVKKHIMALEAETGEVLWKTGNYTGVFSNHDVKERITRLAITVGKEHLFFLDGDWVVALDQKRGAEVWRSPRPPHPPVKADFGYYYPNLCTLVYQDGNLFLVQPRPIKGVIPYEAVKSDLVSFSASSGKKQWEKEIYHWSYGAPTDIFVINNLVWAHDILPYSMIGINPLSGKVERRFLTEKAMRTSHHHRCYRNKATQRYILTGRRGIEFLDVESGENKLHHWVRGTCQLGIMPCNGLLYVPPHPCICYITAKLNGFYSLAPEFSNLKKEEKVKSTSRLERGPIYGSGNSGKSKINQADWPTYRHDSKRSGFTPCRVPTELDIVWKKKIPGKPSSSVVGNDQVFVTSVETHRLFALDDKTGNVNWYYTADGKIDTPPTLYRNLVLFGSVDGWVYCLRTSDGKLIWRFRAAPRERLVMDHGQLASSWPLHGSVLIRDSLAYVCAGRSSFLDGGIYLYALNPENGEVIQERCIYSPDTKTGEMIPTGLPYDMPEVNPGSLSDILINGDKYIYMRHTRLEPKTLTTINWRGGIYTTMLAEWGTKKYPESQEPPQLISESGLLDDSWFNQSYWTIEGHSHSRLLVYDSSRVYGVRAYEGTKRHSRSTFIPGKKGYKLFANDKKTKKEIWSRMISVRVRAMVLAGDKLFVGGPPDVVVENDPWAAFEGRKGAKLCIFSADCGKELASYELKALPVYDGMIAANNRIYISLQDGSILCFGEK